MDWLDGETLTEIGEDAPVMVMAALNDFVVSETEVAVTVTVAGLGSSEGAV